MVLGEAASRTNLGVVPTALLAPTPDPVNHFDRHLDQQSQKSQQSQPSQPSQPSRQPSIDSVDTGIQYHSGLSCDPDQDSGQKQATCLTWQPASKDNVRVSEMAMVLSAAERARRCSTGAALVVHGFGDVGSTEWVAHKHGYPTHWSHVMRNWLPRMWACREQQAPACSRLYVPDEIHPLYRSLAVSQGLQLVGDAELSRTQNVTCTLQQDSPSYWRLYRRFSDFAPSCESADIVLVQRDGKDSTNSRRSIVNSKEVWRAVRTFAKARGLRAAEARFDALSFADQRQLVCSTRLLVAQHGAGEGHALWTSAEQPALLELPPAIAKWWTDIMAERGVNRWFLNQTDGVDVRARRFMGQLNANITMLTDGMAMLLDQQETRRRESSAERRSAAALFTKGAPLEVVSDAQARLRRGTAQASTWNSSSPQRVLAPLLITGVDRASTELLARAVRLLGFQVQLPDDANNDAEKKVEVTMARYLGGRGAGIALTAGCTADPNATQCVQPLSKAQQALRDAVASYVSSSEIDVSQPWAIAHPTLLYLLPALPEASASYPRVLVAVRDGRDVALGATEEAFDSFLLANATNHNPAGATNLAQAEPHTVQRIAFWQEANQAADELASQMNNGGLGAVHFVRAEDLASNATVSATISTLTGIVGCPRQTVHFFDCRATVAYAASALSSTRPADIQSALVAATTTRETRLLAGLEKVGRAGLERWGYV